MGLAQAQVIQRKVHRDRLGQKKHTDVIHFVSHSQGNYNYHIKYPKDATRGDMERDTHILERMGSEQEDKMIQFSGANGKTVSAAGLSATICDAAIHIDGPHDCRLILRFWVNERNIMAGTDFKAGTPAQLPDPPDVRQYIKDYLTDLAND